MNSKSEKQIPIFKVLENNGWHNEDNQMYPPHGTFWISGNTDLPIFMIVKMRDNAKNTLQQLSKGSHLNKHNYQNFSNDLKSLIRITEEVIQNEIITK